MWHRAASDCQWPRGPWFQDLLDVDLVLDLATEDKAPGRGILWQVGAGQPAYTPPQGPHIPAIVPTTTATRAYDRTLAPPRQWCHNSRRRRERIFGRPLPAIAS